jgi:hypothetical protein
MKGQKQSKTDHQAKQIQALINVVQQLLDEIAYLKDLAVGTLETIKCMPDYDEAIEKLKEKVEKQKKEKDDVS